MIWSLFPFGKVPILSRKSRGLFPLSGSPVRIANATICTAWLHLLQINSARTVSVETGCLMKPGAVSVLVSHEIGAVSPVSERFLGVKWRQFADLTRR